MCLEVEFISIPNALEKEINRVLEKYQIKVFKYLDFFKLIKRQSALE